MDVAQRRSGGRQGEADAAVGVQRSLRCLNAEVDGLAGLRVERARLRIADPQELRPIEDRLSRGLDPRRLVVALHLATARVPLHGAPLLDEEWLAPPDGVFVRGGEDVAERHPSPARTGPTVVTVGSDDVRA